MIKIETTNYPSTFALKKRSNYLEFLDLFICSEFCSKGNRKNVFRRIWYSSTRSIWILACWLALWVFEVKGIGFKSKSGYQQSDAENIRILQNKYLYKG
ncbi:unnamed protein product [Schistosoma bovis]|nr:unnamed protein product [Schistosoma bovis]